MFPRMNITTPLPSLAYLPPQYGAGVGFGGINPVVPYVANPYVSSPAAAPFPMIGPSPYAVQPMLPYPPGPLSAAVSPISPWYSPFSWSPYSFAQAPSAYPAIPAIHPALAGMTPSAFSSPATCIDPVTGAIVPSPYPAAQGLLPIRPLIAAAQCDPVQIAAMCAMAPPAMVDPYSVMAHVPSPMPVSPVPPMMRSPLYMSPVGSPTVGLPYTVTAGIPC